MNVNTPDYWNARFATGDWERAGGNTQTSQFAAAQAPRLLLPRDFQGKFVDFGCGEGDAIPVFHRTWPLADYVGVDFSEEAVKVATARHGSHASFLVGNHESCPVADVILASNIMEHLDDDIGTVRALLRRCHDLFVVVPFEEQFLIEEHVRRYRTDSFSCFNVKRVTVFPCRGWSYYGLRARWWNVHIKNVLRPFFGRMRLNRRLQVMYHMRGDCGED